MYQPKDEWLPLVGTLEILAALALTGGEAERAVQYRFNPARQCLRHFDGFLALVSEPADVYLQSLVAQGVSLAQANQLVVTVRRWASCAVTE